MTDPQTRLGELDELAAELRAGLDIRDRRHRLKTHPACFVGQEACDWMVARGIAADTDQAQALGQLLLDNGQLHHVLREHRFENRRLFYRFTADEAHGAVPRSADGDKASWRAFLGEAGGSARRNGNLLPQLPAVDLADSLTDSWHGIEPADAANARLLDNVHPRDWVDASPEPIYDMLVIGAGSGGLVTAAGAAGLGARVALIEENLLGGDCLNAGCVPSKALIASARAVARMRDAGRLGVRINGQDPAEADISADFAAIMQRMRERRADISEHDSAERFAHELGVDVFLGRGRFTGDDTLEVNGKTLRFKRCCIATGGRPALPPGIGIGGLPYLTNMNLFNLTALPPRLAVIGGGPIGLEMAQCFARFGSQVTLLTRGPRILSKEDEDAAAIVHRQLVADGIDIRCDVRLLGARHIDRPGEFPLITVELDEGQFEVDAILLATSRKPNIDDLGLETAGVEADPVEGIFVNDQLQSTNPRIYAAGDVATRYQFTHAADFMARTVLRNALFYGKDRFSRLLIPWCTYSDPEIAHVGLYPRDLEKQAIAHHTITKHFAEIDRARLEDRTEGFVRIHLRAGSDEILGATIVGEQAGELIGEIALAIHAGVGLAGLAAVIHPYPTLADAIRQAGDEYNRSRLTPTVRMLLRGLLGLRRGL